MKEKIQQQLQEYRKQYERDKANLNALSGAIQALEALLEDIRKEEKNGD